MGVWGQSDVSLFSRSYICIVSQVWFRGACYCTDTVRVFSHANNCVRLYSVALRRMLLFIQQHFILFHILVCQCASYLVKHIEKIKMESTSINFILWEP